MMVLFSGSTCPFSHRCRFVLYEKGCDFEVQDVDLYNKPPEIDAMNPYGEVPILVERDLTLYQANIINEYIDERFPHPQLMPADPVGRARTRLFLHVLERELFPHVKVLENARSNEDRRELARRRLRENLDILSMRVGDTKFLLSDDFGMIDVVLAPILWRVPYYGIQLSATATKLEIYAQRLFARQSFIDSMTAQERTMRK